MTLLSKLRPLLQAVRAQSKSGSKQMSDHRVFPMEPSRWPWTKFKDYFHFYVMLGVIPCSLFVTGMNLFIGPATLSEIPEGYTPKYWEYYKSPVTRFLARYLYNNPQQDYEKYLTYLFTEHEKIRLRELEAKIKDRMFERSDYQAYYFMPPSSNYYKVVKEKADKLRDLDDISPIEV